MPKVTVNVKYGDGTGIDMTSRVIDKQKVLTSKVYLEDMSKQTNKTDFRGGTILIQPSREIRELTPTQFIGDIQNAGGASSQYFEKVETEAIKHTDRFVLNITDDAKLKAEAGQDLISGEVANFMQSIRVKDAEYIFAQAQADADASPLYSTLAKNNASDQYATVPSGTQPAQVDNTFDEALVALQGGKRLVNVEGNGWTNDAVSTYLDNALAYGTTLGTNKNPVEILYKFAIGGINLNEFKIFTTYLTSKKIGGGNVRQIVNTDKLQPGLAIQGIVKYYDLVPVIISNQLGDLELVVMTNRVATRDLDTIEGMHAEVYKGGHVIEKLDGTMVQTSTTDRILEVKSERHIAIVFPLEFWGVKLV